MENIKANNSKIMAIKAIAFAVLIGLAIAAYYGYFFKILGIYLTVLTLAPLFLLSYGLNSKNIQIPILNGIVVLILLAILYTFENRDVYYFLILRGMLLISMVTFIYTTIGAGMKNNSTGLAVKSFLIMLFYMAVVISLNYVNAQSEKKLLANLTTQCETLSKDQNFRYFKVNAEKGRKENKSILGYCELKNTQDEAVVKTVPLY